MNALSVPCPYCRERAGDPCRITILPGRPVREEPHVARIEAAGIDWNNR